MSQLMWAAFLIWGADKAEPEPKPVAPPKADIRGTVSEVSGLKARGLIGRMLVEGKKEKDTQYDKASVTLPMGVKIHKWQGGKKVEVAFKDIVPGCVVQCVFDGPVAESYPVQARASEVLILSFPKKK